MPLIKVLIGNLAGVSKINKIINSAALRQEAKRAINIKLVAKRYCTTIDQKLASLE
ncbi:MAG: hypothetical protein ACI9YH_002754 [Colwellia sp.]|jgi:hypothetical protein